MFSNNTFKILGLVSCLVLFLACANQSPESASFVPDEDAERIDASYSVEAYPNNTRQKAFRQDASGRIIEDGDVENGVKVGTWTTYHNNFVTSVTSYRQGHKHGLFIRANNFGTIEERAHFVDGKLDGLRVVYSRNKIREESYFKQGQMHGSSKKYYDDGITLQEDGVFKNGKRDGVVRWYDISGAIKIEMTYKDGKKVE